ncbi:MAG: outer membrane lipoprotein carrier protein LolA [Prolixibacteraceae bacterium]|jgi:outer membrane lipoprotein-sorting protein|nr:outer membrane lipoprotein carrier protein LolA [Prolixibacteraceae bacterium]
MKSLFLTILITIQAFSIFSQDTQDAKKILDKVSEQTRSYISITTDFDFIMENKEVDIREVNSGYIILQNNKYKLNLNGIEIFNNGETQWTYMPDAEEVNISEAVTDENDYMNPANIFTMYENGFSYKLIGETPSGNYKIELSPDEINEFSKITLEIENDSHQIDKAIMTGTDGNSYIINLKNWDVSKEYPETTFEFNAGEHPSVNIIDLR